MGKSPQSLLHNQLHKLYVAETTRFDQLVQAVGLDPATDFTGRDLRDLRFTGARLDGFDFSKSDLQGTMVREASSVRDAIFDGALLDPDDQKFIESGISRRSPSQKSAHALLPVFTEFSLPEFWEHDGVLARLLSPLAAVFASATARRMARPGWRAPVPVVCVGSAGVGGAGKTTVALALAARLQARGQRVAFLTRGYGGRLAGPLHVDAGARGAAEVGDEALLLAAIAPTYLGIDRAATARLAVADGARVLVLHDGLQNPSLAKDLSFLVVDGAYGFGNGRVIPAGPLREKVAQAASRCGAALLIGDDIAGAATLLPPGLPVVRGQLVSEPPPTGALVAFAGIGRPEKFRETLVAAGGDVRRLHAFPDHHPYTAADLRSVFEAAADATVVTTPMDAVRVPPEFRPRVAVVGVRLVWDDPAVIDGMLPC